MAYPLTRAKPKDGERQYITFDIETVDQNGVSDLLGEPVFVSWCRWGEAYGQPCTDLTDWFLQYIFTPEQSGWLIYAHNAMKFDYQRLDWLRLAELGFTGEFLTGKNSGLKGATIRYGEYSWYLRDSLLLIPMGLDKATKTFAPAQRKQKRGSWDYRSFDINDAQDVAYAIQDALSLWHVIRNVDQLLLRTFEVSIHDGVTLPSISYRAFRQSLPKGTKFPSVNYGASAAARDSYHGGQTLSLNTIPHKNEISIDCNSMYAYVMITYPLPMGVAKHVMGLPHEADSEKTLCLATVGIPDGVFPFLKTQTDTGKVGNYKGVCTGWYWLFELEYQKHLGGNFEVLESYYWEEETRSVSDFISVCRELRMSNYFGGQGDLAKLLQNALYGRFAMQVGELNLHMTRNKPDDGIPFYSPYADDMVPCFWWIPAGENYNADMVHWASYITAHARLVLTRAMEQIGFEHVDYCDTDSIFFEERFLPLAESLIGNEYGQFKIEKRMERFQAFAPKAYKYRTMEPIPRKHKKYKFVKFPRAYAKNKGIPTRELLSQNGFARLGKPAQVITYIQSNTLLNRIKRGLTYGRIATRTLATEKSTSNGMIQGGVWEPLPITPRKLTDLRGEKTGLYLRKQYDRFIVNMSNFVESCRKEEKP